jgi:AcrR family transcriptional regulator
MELFMRQGYDGTSLEQVAAAAGFSKGAVYSNFSGKDDLYLALLDGAVEARVAQVAAAVEGARGPADAGRLIGEGFSESTPGRAEWTALQLDYIARAVRDPKVRERFAAHHRQVRARMTEAVKGLVQREVADREAEVLVMAILALSTGLAIERLIDPEAVPDGLFGELLRRLVSGGRDGRPHADDGRRSTD